MAVVCRHVLGCRDTCMLDRDTWATDFQSEASICDADARFASSLRLVRAAVVQWTPSKHMKTARIRSPLPAHVDEHECSHEGASIFRRELASGGCMRGLQTTTQRFYMTTTCAVRRRPHEIFFFSVQRLHSVNKLQPMCPKWTRSQMTIHVLSHTAKRQGRRSVLGNLCTTWVRGRIIFPYLI